MSDHLLGKNPLTPQESLALRGEIARLQESITPGGTYMSSGYSPAEQNYLNQQALEQRRASNNLGIAFLGPLAGGPAAAVRALGGSEAAVESAGEMGMGLLALPGAGGARGTPRAPARAPMEPTGTHVYRPPPRVVRGNMTREQTREWMLKNGVPPEKVDSYLDGVNFNRPVDVVELPQGSELGRYGNPDYFSGQFATPPGTPGNTLGIDMAGRVPGSATLGSPVEALRSTASDFGGFSGGGTQYQLGSGWRDIRWRY